MLGKLLETERWLGVLNNKQVNDCAQNFITILKKHISDSSNKIYIKCKQRRLTPWITQGIIVSIRHRDRLKKQCTLQPNNIDIVNQYKTHRKMLSNLISKVKTNYYKEILEENKNNSKKTWEIIRKVSNDIKSIQKIMSIINENVEELKSDKAIAEEFNKYFSTVGSKLAQDIVAPPEATAPAYDMAASTMFLRPVSEADLIQQINTLKPKSASGSDCISSDVLRLHHTHLLRPLVHLINLIFTTGIFPDIFKGSIIFHFTNREIKKNLVTTAL